MKFENDFFFLIMINIIWKVAQMRGFFFDFLTIIISCLIYHDGKLYYRINKLRETLNEIEKSFTDQKNQPGQDS